MYRNMTDALSNVLLMMANDPANTLRGLIGEFCQSGAPGPSPQKLESICSTFLSALNLAVIGTSMGGILSKYFVI